MVLDELDAGVEVRRVELIRNVPTNRSELSPFLYDTVHECNGEQHRFPLLGVGHVQLVLRQAGVGSLQAGLHALRRLVGEFDWHLKQSIEMAVTRRHSMESITYLCMEFNVSAAHVISCIITDRVTQSKNQTINRLKVQTAACVISPARMWLETWDELR